jgi:hypothetical protein
MFVIKKILKEGNKLVFRFSLLLLIWLVYLPDQVIAQHHISASQPMLGNEGKPMLFRHPKLGYLVAIPPDTIVEQKDEINGIIMKSRKGYMITLQTGSAKTGTPLQELMSKLEQRYLGNGRPWSRKLREGPTRLAGLNAFEALYEGAGSMVRVIVTRGSKLDYAFIFIAPPQEFSKLIGDFNWVLQSFRPVSRANNKGEFSQQGDGLNEMMSGNVRHMIDSELGFTIDYPDSWIVEKGDGPFVVISGKKGTPAYFATVNIQNVYPDVGTKDITQATQNVVAGLKGLLKQADPNVSFPGQGAYAYSQQGLILHGLQFTVLYERKGEKFRQWNVVLARQDNTIVHVWSYAAPEDRYDRYGAIAGKMLETWKLVNR